MTASPMTATERVMWRQVTQAAYEAARDPAGVSKAKALRKAFAGADNWRYPDLRPLPLACFRAFLMLARGYSAEPDPAVRAALASRLAGLADAAGDILDGLRGCEAEQPRHGWQDRADLT